MLFVSICLVGVVISFLISKYGKEQSFKYNDEEELENEQAMKIEEELQSSTSSN